MEPLYYIVLYILLYIVTLLYSISTLRCLIVIVNDNGKVIQKIKFGIMSLLLIIFLLMSYFLIMSKNFGHIEVIVGFLSAGYIWLYANCVIIGRTKLCVNFKIIIIKEIKDISIIHTLTKNKVSLTLYNRKKYILFLKDEEVGILAEKINNKALKITHGSSHK